MNAKVTIGEVSFDITGATSAELIEFVKAGNAVATKHTDVVSVTREAITAPKKAKRPMNYIAWTRDDLGFMAKMAVDLGPDAKVPASAIANAMKGRPHNKRTYGTLYAMSYNIARFLKSGKGGNLSKSNIKDLAEMGYTSGMMSASPSNFLGEVRRLEVQQA